MGLKIWYTVNTILTQHNTHTHTHTNGKRRPMRGSNSQVAFPRSKVTGCRSSAYVLASVRHDTVKPSPPCTSPCHHGTSCRFVSVQPVATIPVWFLLAFEPCRSLMGLGNSQLGSIFRNYWAWNAWSWRRLVQRTVVKLPSNAHLLSGTLSLWCCLGLWRLEYGIETFCQSTRCFGTVKCKIHHKITKN